jgi:Kae1-associated kinase Bud32
MEVKNQGAEAIIRLCSGGIVKERIKKAYRISELDDSIRKKRTKSEAKLLLDARSIGVMTPKIINIGKFDIEMEHIEGKKLKDIFDHISENERKIVCEKIGQCVAKLHFYDIIHGDLTTSNFIMSGCDLYIIDFGLGFYSKRAEDKASDLHLLYQALKSTHFNNLKDTWEIILNTYRTNYGDANNGHNIINKLNEIRERGRYK